MPPARCGLATFNADLIEAVRRAEPDTVACPIAVRQAGEEPDRRADGAAAEARFEDPDSYDRLAGVVDRLDLLCVQHEYGIFGGADGEHLLCLLERCRTPVVAVLHTVLDAPSPNQKRVMDAIVARAERLVVMTERSAAVMRQVHDVPERRLAVIPHGIPDRVPTDRGAGIALMGSAGRRALLTFGLLSPGKGIEHAVAALPAIARAVPDVLYVVMGATHPNLLRRDGERYRDGLRALAERLGVGDRLRFVNRYVDLPELTAALAAAELYLTPYLNEAQSVSGTLAYSVGLGSAVVSTPYHHAAELLAGGRGALVPFADPPAIAEAVTGLLSDPVRLGAMREAALAAGREMGWGRVGQRYAALFREAMAAPAGPDWRGLAGSAAVA
ncbi:MAG: glycosyltransferase family 4 protein [Gluconacetobacter diazotrophicus]|nr:glycosyltransferase family 4 protein [Gluconacetobacter diazotrophicus]